MREEQPNRSQRQPGGQSPQGPGSLFGGKGPSRRLIIILLFLALMVVPWLIPWLSGNRSQQEISYTTFRGQLEQGNIQQVTVSGEKIVGTFRDATEVSGREGQALSQFVTYLPSFGDPELMPLLESQDVELVTQPSRGDNWMGTLFGFLPMIILIWLFYSFSRNMRSQGQGLFNVGRSKARLYQRSQQSTTFEDVAGIRSAKEELKEIVEFLKHPDRFRQIGAKSPKGVLLVGPPGSGKTLLARAVAGEAEVPFFSITGSDFMEMFVGVGASRVRSLFQDAKKNAPSIIFIDELDSIGRHRGAGLGGGHDEREQTLNQLLSEMDGFEPQESTIVMAATNRPDILDPALLRPGRFDRRVTVDLPTMLDRVEILKIHARGKPLAESVDLEAMARSTPGFSGADLENLLNEAALVAARRRKSKIEMEDVNEAFDKILLGLERSNMALTDEDKRLIALHESGHALLAALLPHTDPIHKVTIIPRARSMGVTQQMPERDRYLYDRDYLLDRLAVMMGGRAAEELKADTLTSGAENDLKQATQLARKMVLDWGMSERLRHLALGGPRQHVFLGEEIGRPREYSETTAREIDEEVTRILSQAFDRASSTLEEHEGQLEALVALLLEKEALEGREVVELVASGNGKGQGKAQRRGAEAREGGKQP
ncbi:MAG: ATP-dependent zinc metalloprotease FtsH [Spirochaetales bacterium]|nr:ATP-dependent zinc metalloprotease FtsH [Spirochaetales bacterium]